MRLRDAIAIITILLASPAACGTQQVADGTSNTTTIAFAVENPEPPSTSTTSPRTSTAGYSQAIAELWETAVVDGLQDCGGSAEPRRTDEEWLQFYDAYWTCTVESGLAAVDSTRSETPPAELASLSSAYLGAISSYFETLRDETRSLATVAEHETFIEGLYQGFSLQEQLKEIAVTCADLQSGADAIAFALALDCPDEPADRRMITAEYMDAWTVTPEQIPAGDGPILLTIRNRGVDPVVPIVVDVWEGGDPANLPVIDGLVDIGLSGVIDPSSGFSSFGVAYAGGVEFVEGGFVGEPQILDPGAEVEAEIWATGPMVIFDYRRGEYQAGSYLVIEFVQE